MTPRSIVIFDLGGVLLEWNPRHLYRKLFDYEAAVNDPLIRHHRQTAPGP